MMKPEHEELLHKFRSDHPEITDADQAYSLIFDHPSLHAWRHAWWDRQRQEQMAAAAAEPVNEAAL